MAKAKKTAKKLSGEEKKIIEEFKEKREMDEILKDIKLLEEKLIEKKPDLFSSKDIIYAVFGSLVIASGFAFKGALVRTVNLMTALNVIWIISLTLIVLTLEIYFISYQRVPNKQERRFGQFWAKRFFTLYAISLIVSFMMIYIFGVNHSFQEHATVFKAVITISFPASIGAAIPTLLKKY
ncbi:DUF2391 family protein [Candidatus Woesearchaeota archaeon]|nr:DUF2391 family protein [Candidatus Woesearchaeota archaeon]